MKIILDVSAAFAVITGAPSSKHFLPQLELALQVLAPDLFCAEATNAAWKYHHIEDATPNQSQAMAKRAIQLVDIFVPSDSIWKEALDLACQLAYPAYDCYYLIIARQQEATLLTADKGLIKIARKLNIPTIGPTGQVD